MRHTCIKVLFDSILCLLLLEVSSVQARNQPDQFQILSLDVHFIAAEPVLDGLLDSELQNLPIYRFSSVETDAKEAPDLELQYRIAYSASFLYVFIEVGTENLVSRDRAYQNGDGFHLALTRTEPGGLPTKHFFVMGFSPAAVSESSRRKFIWYHDVDLSFTALKDARLETASRNGKTGIELLLPWKHVYPYHPWISDGIGFNLCYVQAVGETERVFHYVVEDPFFQSEQRERRYAALRFAIPKQTPTSRAYAVLERNHLFPNDSLRVKIAAITKRTPLDVTVEVASIDREVLHRRSFQLDFGGDLLQQSLVFEDLQLKPGSYIISWIGAESALSGETAFSVLPSYHPDRLADRLELVRERLSPGSFTTLQFKMAFIEELLDTVEPYDPAREVLEAIQDFITCLEIAESGKDPIARRTGIQRRAYRSKIDDSLQPYSIKVPEDFEPRLAYPLLVYLHGSGEDDRNQLTRPLSHGGFIELAPRGRGTSNAYSTDHAQDDIREAIDDVIANYPIDTSRIILVGFSMGGYGVYRTYFENPSRFKALAVFSGHPDLANRYLGGGHPDFLNPMYLEFFRSVPIFIFHGDRDRNCPIEDTLRLVDLLRDAGAEVEFHLDLYKGHERPPEKTLEAYFNWLSQQISR